MSNAVVYVRVSTEEQAGKAQNLPTQKRKCEARCEQEGLTVAKVFTDAGQSARTTERPEFQAMLEYCRKHKGKISHVVFADLSRLARNVADQSVTLTTFRQLGITPISCDETIENSAAGKLSGWLTSSFLTASLSGSSTGWLLGCNKVGGSGLPQSATSTKELRTAQNSMWMVNGPYSSAKLLS
jgi:DNA invertase Pin-like site-specific DNA recombinase